MSTNTNNISCFTCEIVSEYTGLASQFTQDLSTALLGPMWALYLSLAGLWVVIQGLRLVLTFADPAQVGKEFVFLLIAGFLLSGQGPELVSNIYTVSLAIMGSAASAALQVGDASPTVTAAANGAIPLNEGMTALVYSAEKGVREVFAMAEYMSSVRPWDDLMPILYAFILVVPYFLVLVVYFAQVVISIFRVMMLAALSPFMMLGLGFGWGRDMAKAGFKTLISAFLVLFGATAALAVMLYGVDSLNISGLSEDEVSELASVNNPKFLLALALGWLGTAFMTEATGMANSIAGSLLTNTGVGVITAGASATALALKGGPVGKFLGQGAMNMFGTAGSGAGWAASKTAIGVGYGAGAVGHHASQAVQDLVAKAKNYGQNKG